MRKARDLGCKRVATIAHGAGIGGMTPREAAQATVEGAVMGVYQHLENKSQGKDNKAIDELMLLTADTKQTDQLIAGANAGEIIGNAVNTARTLANRPPNLLYPITFAEFAQQNGFQFLKGEYIATAKNEMVKDHYKNLQFEPENNYWVLAVANYQIKKCFITPQAI